MVSVKQESHKDLPMSMEAEETVLACALLDAPGTLALAHRAGVSGASFSRAEHGVLWDRIEALFAAGVMVDVATVAEDLKRHGLLEEAGGVNLLNRISDRVPTTVRIAYWLEVVRETAARRAVLRHLREVDELTRRANGGFEAWSSAVAPALERVHELTQRRAEKPMVDVVQEIQEEAQAWLEGREPERSTVGLVWTPWQVWNDYFGPLEPAELCIVGARPSQGKSSLARQLEQHALTAGHGVVTFSLEMTRRQWLRSAAATVARVNLREGPRELVERLQDYAKRVEWLGDRLGKQWHLFDGTHSAAQIASRARLAGSAMAQHGVRLGLVIVDYLQFIQLPDVGRWNRDEAVGLAALQMKRVAQELECAVVLVAALNRESDREARPPRLSDLRASGETEFHADRVVFLHKPEIDASGATQGPDASHWEMHLIQGKNRTGALGYHRVTFQRPFTRFVDVAGSSKVSLGVARRKEEGELGKRDSRVAGPSVGVRPTERSEGIW